MEGKMRLLPATLFIIISSGFPGLTYAQGNICTALTGFSDTSEIIDNQEGAKSLAKYDCSLGFDTYSESRGSGGSGSVGILDVVNASGSGSSSSITTKSSYDRVCASLEETGYNFGSSSTRISKINRYAVDAFVECVRITAGTPAFTVIASAYQIDDVGNEYSIDIKDMTRSQSSLELESFSIPSNVTCEYNDESIAALLPRDDAVAFMFPGRDITFHCHKTEPKNASVQFTFNKGSTELLELKTSRRSSLHTSVRVSPIAFHHTPGYPRASWSVLEVELYDTDGQPIQLDEVFASSCFVSQCYDTSVGGYGLVANITDGNVVIRPQGGQRHGGWWAPAAPRYSDTGEWFELQFEPTELGRLVIHQWAGNGCMRNCGAEKPADRKLRANARDLMIKSGRDSAVVYEDLTNDAKIEINFEP